MTLITAITTDEYVILASDRRVTWIRGSGVDYQEDSSMKSFLLFGHLIMGFTGVAVLEGMPMETWLARTLEGVPPHEAFLRLQIRIQEVFDRTPHFRSQPHTFVAVGFARRPDRSLIPVGIYLSNCMNPRGVPDPSHVTGQFLGRKMELGNQRHNVLTIGWMVPEGQRYELECAARTALRANPRDPFILIEPTIQMMREVARGSNGAVGESILIVSIPKAAVPVDGWALGVRGVRPHGESYPYAFYFEQNSITTNEAIAYLPAMYWQDQSIIGLQILDGDHT